MGEPIRLVEVPNPVNEDAIGLVEEVLARLKAGETLSLAVIEVKKQRTVGIAWSVNENYHELMSGAARLQARLALMED